MPDWLTALPGLLFSFGVLVYSLATALHALMRRLYSRSAVGWIALCVFFPLIGATLYWLFGQNRIFTRAEKLKTQWPEPEKGADGVAVTRELLTQVTSDPVELEQLLGFARVADNVTRRPLVPGNRVEPLHDAEEAYPAMLAAIEGAEKCVHLLTFLFDGKRTVREFGTALAAATKRGVDVRVLLDGVGELYAWPWTGRVLARMGVRVARFLPPSFSARGIHLNLRNHRKVLVVDGDVAFTGGMNLRDKHYVSDPNNPHRTRDLHFRVTGPVVSELDAAFLEDWGFATGEENPGPPTPPPPPAGTALCRVIQDGPNEDFEVMTWTLLGAISGARREVMIVTPYFIPSRELTAALGIAALRGVSVRILLPGKSNQPLVDWATRAMIWELLERGVRIAFQPPPFPHTKYMVIDRLLSSIGSTNLDPRSLRLNFELNLSVYDSELAGKLAFDFERDWKASHETGIPELEAESFPARVRNHLARLCEPYL